MKKESRDQILRAYDDVARLLKFENFSAFLRYACRKVEEQVHRLKQARSRERLNAYLAKEPEPTPQELGATVDAIRLLPYTLRDALPKAGKEAAKKIPHRPGGRPRGLKDYEYVEVCKDIGSLLAEGVGLKDAQKRLAKRKDVSLRTVQRVWQRRAEIAKEGPANESRPPSC
jgi:hypothetical protein